jgi:hypothetical protein
MDQGTIEADHPISPFLSLLASTIVAWIRQTEPSWNRADDEGAFRTIFRRLALDAKKGRTLRQIVDRWPAYECPPSEIFLDSIRQEFGGPPVNVRISVVERAYAAKWRAVAASAASFGPKMEICTKLRTLLIS